MAKSSKKLKAAPAPENPAIVLQSETRNGNGLSQSGLVEPKVKAGKPAKATTRVKTAEKAQASTSRKSVVRRKARGSESTGRSGKRGIPLSDDEIRLRAYFISERRMREGLPGDSGHDWLEARRQLTAEHEARA